MDGRIMRCGIISSCQSAATSEIVKRSWACVRHGAALYQVPDLYLCLYLTNCLLLTKYFSHFFVKLAINEFCSLQNIQWCCGVIDKPVAAICHGPWMLCSAKCLQGRRLTGLVAVKDDIENAGSVCYTVTHKKCATIYFLLLARYVPNVAKRSTWDRCIYWGPTTNRTTSHFGKFQTAISRQQVIRSTSC